MTIATTSFFQTHQDKLKQCLDTGSLSSLMISTAGIGFIAAQNIAGHVNPNVGVCLSVAPFIATALFQHYMPQTDHVSMQLGAIAGMGLTLLMEQTPISFAAGSCLAGITAATIAAGRVRVLR